MNKHIHMTTELLKNQTEAEKAYQDALYAGYAPHNIDGLRSDSHNKYYEPILIKEDTKTSIGLGLGGAAGAALIGTLAAIAAVGTDLIIPGLDLAIAGPIAAGLAGAGAGGITGGLVGALIGFVFLKEKKRYLNLNNVVELGITSGEILLGVREKYDDTKRIKRG